MSGSPATFHFNGADGQGRKIKAGAPWSVTFILYDEAGNPKDLTGYTAKMHFRERYEAPLALELTSTAGITITAAQGKVAPGMDEDETTALVRKARRGVYDLFLYDSGLTPECIMEGEFEVTPAVTR